MEGSSSWKRSLQNFCLWNPVEIVTEWNKDVLKFLMFLLKGWFRNWLADGSTYSVLQWWGNNLLGTWNILGETELSGFRSRSEGSAFSPPRVQMQVASICDCLWTCKHNSPHFGDFLRSWLTQIADPPISLSWLMLKVFLKFLRGSQKPNKRHLSSECLTPFAELLQVWH